MAFTPRTTEKPNPNSDQMLAHREQIRKQLATTAVLRTTDGLRDALFDEIDAVRAGIASPTRVNAIAKIATGIIETTRLEIEAQKFMNQRMPSELNSGQEEDLPREIPPLVLGHQRALASPATSQASSNKK